MKARVRNACIWLWCWLLATEQAARNELRAHRPGWVVIGVDDYANEQPWLALSGSKEYGADELGQFANREQARAFAIMRNGESNGFTYYTLHRADRA